MVKENIEVEVRSFISRKKYNHLLKYFKKNGKFLGKDNQITYYFSGPKDLRIQKTGKLSKLWLKSGKIHEKYRQDIVVRCNKEDFENLDKLLSGLGFKVKIKWFRKRNEFLWKGTRVCLDWTRGYGYIIELEKMTTEKNKEKVYRDLLQKLRELNIKLTPKEIFDKKFSYYKNNWRKLIKPR